MSVIFLCSDLLCVNNDDNHVSACAVLDWSLCVSCKVLYGRGYLSEDNLANTMYKKLKNKNFQQWVSWQYLKLIFNSLVMAYPFLLVCCRLWWQVTLQSLSFDTSGSCCLSMVTGVIPDLPTWCFTSSTRMWYVAVPFQGNHSYKFLSTEGFSKAFFSFLFFSSYCEWFQKACVEQFHFPFACRDQRHLFLGLNFPIKAIVWFN